MSAQAETTMEALDADIRVSAEGVYGEIMNFLVDEAEMLDQDRHMEWLDLLADDISYNMPFRHTLYRRDGNGLEGKDFRFKDDKQMLTLRARRNTQIESALDRDPAPRIHRLIGNLAVRQDPKTPNEYKASSSIMLMRSRFDSPVLELLSAKRKDIIRRTPDGLRLASRFIYTDLANLGNSFTSVFM